MILCWLEADRPRVRKGIDAKYNCRSGTQLMTVILLLLDVERCQTKRTKHFILHDGRSVSV